MGLIQSGDITDCALAALVECDFATEPGVQRKYGIEGYWRFRDDSLCLCNDRQLMKEFFWKYREKAKYFEVVCERIDAVSIDFLNVSVRKTNTVFEISPFFKPGWVDTQPLDLKSGHSPSVLKRWPFAQLNDIRHRSSSSRMALEGQATFIQRFTNHHAPMCLVDLMRSMNVDDCTKGKEKERKSTKGKAKKLMCGCLLDITR